MKTSHQSGDEIHLIGQYAEYIKMPWSAPAPTGIRKWFSLLLLKLGLK